MYAAHLYIKAGLCTAIGSPLRLHDARPPVLVRSCKSMFAGHVLCCMHIYSLPLGPEKLITTSPVLKLSVTHGEAALPRLQIPYESADAM